MSESVLPTLAVLEPQKSGPETPAPEEYYANAGVGLALQLRVVLPLTIALLALAVIIKYAAPEQEPVAWGLGLAGALIAGGPIIWGALKGLASGKTDVNELVAMAIIGAIALGWYVEAGIVALIMQLGALIEGVATEKARKAVLALQKLAPSVALVRRGGREQAIAADAIAVGDILIIRPGDRIGADGNILTGSTSLDESSITGESVPVDKTVGAQVLAGTMNLTGAIEVEVHRVGAQSALGQTIALVRRAQQFQPRAIRAAEIFFAYYTPIMLAFSLVVLWVTRDPNRLVTLWVVGCPAEVLLASPLAIVVTLARASRSGIQVKAGPFVEASANLNTVVFDKTGTLTTGQFIVAEVRPAGDISAEELLTLAAGIESRSTHPLAVAIVTHVRKLGLTPVRVDEVNVREGLGLEARVNGEEVMVGSLRAVPEYLRIQAQALEPADVTLPLVGVFVVRAGVLLGALLLTDEIRPEAARTIKRLRALGVRRVAMLTGDRKRSAELVGRAVGCDDIYSELLPGQKVDIVRQLQRGNRGVAMVGDGINDAPSLAAASVGIAMGVRGTDVAISAADAILLKDDLTRVPLLIYLARQTRSAIFQNLALAIGFAVIEAVGAAFGLIGPVAAALIHVVGVVVIVVNSIRLAGTPGRSRNLSPVVREQPIVVPPASTI